MAGTPLETRIAALRGRVRRLLALHGMSWVVGGCLLGVIVAGLADWLIHLAPEVRLAALVGLVGLCGWLAARYVVRPLVVRFRDLDIALRIEKRWPGLNDQLASTVQFLNAQGHETWLGSKELREATVAQTLKETEPIDFREVVDPKPARRAMGFAGSALAVGLLLVFLAPGLSQIAVRRLFSPYGSARWPQQTHLRIVEAARRVARGEPFTLAVAVGHKERMPASARVTYRFPNGELASEPLRPEEGGRFRGRIEAVSRSFAFSVAAGDDITGWQDVEVVPPPVIEQAKIVVKAPAYTALASQTLAPGRTQIKAFEGSEVAITAGTNKPIAEALFHQGEKASGPPVTIDKTGRSLAAHFRVAGSEPFWFTLRDTDGFRNQEAVRYEVRSIRDEAPRVVIEDPDSDRDVPPKAIVPVQIDVDDDLGIQSIRLLFRIAAANSEATSERTLPLWESKVQPAPGASLTKHQEVHYRWDLAELNLEPGSILSVYADARDFDDIKGPNLGKSRVVRLRIATADEINRQLDDRRRAIREEAERILAMQKQGMTPVDEALRTLNRTEQLDPGSRQSLKTAEMIQRQVGSRVTSKSDGLEQKVRQFVQDLDDFKLDSPDIRAQMEQMRAGVQRIKDNHLAPAEQGLTRASKALEDVPATPTPGAQPQPKSQAANQPSAKRDQAEGKSDAGQADAGKEGAKGAEASKKEARKGEAGKSEAGKSEAGKSEAGKSEAGKSEAGKSEAGKSEAGKSEAGKSEAGKSEAGKSEAGKSETGKADSAQSQAGQNQEGKQDAASNQGDQNQPANQAKPSPGSQAAKSALAESKTNQKAIADELQKMLDGLSEFETYREAVKDAQNLLKAQEEAMKHTAEAASKPDLTGKTPDALTEAQKAQLENLAARQNEVGKGLQNLEGKMDEMGKRTEDADPMGAAALKEAAEQSRKQGTAAQMGQAAEQLAKNQMGAAQQGQEQARKQLKELVDMLQNRRDRSLAHLVKELKQAEQDLKSLAKRQAENLAKTQKARQNPNAQKRAEELQRLAKEQEQIQKEMKRQLQRLAKLRADAAAQAASKASGKMGQAQQDLDQDKGDQAAQDQEDALADLDDAREELEQARRDAEEQLAMEQLAKMSDSLKALSQRQDKVVEETDGFEKDRAARQGKLTFAQRNEIRNLGQVQEGLRDETGELVEKLEGAPVFALTLRRAAEGMETAAKRLELLKTDEDTQRAERAAANRFKQLLKALEPDKGKPGAGGGQNQGGGAGGGGGANDDSIPTTAQLKMLKALQEEINERTEYLDEMRTRHKTLNPDQEAELARLQDDQRTLGDLTRDLTRPRKDDGEE